MHATSTRGISTIQGLIAISPVIVFMALYLAVSLLLDDFYRMPIPVAMAAASVWAVAIYRGHRLADRIDVFSRAAGHSDILYMIWIFILAGAFAALAKGIGCIDATVGITLKVFPPEYLLPGIFVAACLISLSIGTSVGTVVALTPLVVELAREGGGDVALYTATVLGGAFFGDNLSFISDTTIAATRTQGCDMADKFKANVWIAVPAAVLTLVLYVVLGHEYPTTYHAISQSPSAEWWLVIPYLLIIVLAVSGINVTIVLTCGILSAAVLGLTGGVSLLDSCSLMGSGIESMGSLIVITLLAAGMLGMVKASGGITFILHTLTRGISGSRATQWCIAALVGVVNLCTANNTVAIITVGSMSRELAERAGIDPRKAASLLDSCSCIVQVLIPYGAQTLLATGLAGISPAAPWPYLYYPWALALMVGLSIILRFPRKFS
ncbi:MAG: Na+/H+ antiporter NhaC family protein [Muribaculaceae bacterium]|nr:Na+/H+ antiporter NhaC family protein [Muribaculaceae bacterium]